jgi:vacuolar-type H+-ATPase subunit H
MSDSLKDLLQAETEAEAIVADGEQERERIVQKALGDARDMETRFQARMPELYRSFSEKAEKRAEQMIEEMKLRNDERNKELRELAARHEKEALDHAIDLILGAGEADS